MRFLSCTFVLFLTISATAAQILPEDLKLVSDKTADQSDRQAALMRVGVARIDNIERLYPVLLPILLDEGEESSLRTLAAGVIGGSIWSEFENSSRLQPIVPQLVTCTLSADRSLSQACAGVLVYVRPSISVEYLEPLLEFLPQASPLARVSLVSVLGRIEGAAERTSDVLLDMVSQLERGGFRQFAESLPSLAGASQRAVRFLRDSLSSDDPQEVTRAAITLSAIGRDGLPALDELRGILERRNLDEDVRNNVEYAVEELERTARSVSLSGSDLLRRAADAALEEDERVEALAQLEKGQGDFAELIKLAGSFLENPEKSSSRLVKAVLQTLNRVVTEDFSRASNLSGLVPGLIDCIGQGDRFLRGSCTGTLTLVRPSVPASQADVLFAALLEDPSTDVRIFALETLHRIEEVQPRLNGVLLSILETEVGAPLLAAACKALRVPQRENALSRQPPSARAVSAVSELVRHPTPEVQVEAIRALARFGPQAASALTSLQAVQRDANSSQMVRILSDVALRAISAQ